MNDLKQKAFKNLLKGLENLGCSYIVIDPDGGEYKYGDALAPVTKTKKSNSAELRNYCWPLIKDLKPGEAIEVPAGPYTLDEIQTTMCLRALTEWGAGSYVTARNKEKECVEILRVF